MKNIPQIREISTLSFNERVLQEAEDERIPVMERLKFLGIFSSNMDEFFKVRVASIRRRIEIGKEEMATLMEEITDQTQELDERFQKAYRDIVEALAVEDIHFLQDTDLHNQPETITQWVRDYFRENVLPSLVPIILEKRTPFPQLVDGHLYLGIKMSGEKSLYALLEIPAELPRFVETPNHDFVYIDDVIRFNLQDIFYIFEYGQIEAYAFKISRDAELDIDNDFSEGHVRKMERVLRQRKGGRPTRLVVDSEMPQGLYKILMKELTITDYDTVISGSRYHNMKDLMSFPNRRTDLAFQRREYAQHRIFDGERRNMLDQIARQDMLVTYPYQSFDHVVRLLREAAIDPLVEGIKMTLYRVAANSQVVNALCNAARNGKAIFVNIELLARFDEENNIAIAERLNEAGASVAFGVPPMKVHSKLLLIKRKNTNIVALSTGNFNEKTGKLYVDSTLFTANKVLCNEADTIFNYLENAAKRLTTTTPKFSKLLVSPFNARRALMRLIQREQKKGTEGYILLKVNHLTDSRILNKLRSAAQAGVKMDLIVRTTYAMLPHENIRAISILDRYLEHQRIYIFGRGDDCQVYMSSADLMERNLDWRVEVAFPIEDPELIQEVLVMMHLQVNDTYKARVLDEEQSNFYVNFSEDGLRAQDATYQYLLELGKAIPGKEADANQLTENISVS